MTVTIHPVTDLTSLLDLEVVEPDAFLGASPALGWERIYGGQVVAQALMAAGRTVDAALRPHSLHAYFIRMGSEVRPVLYEVERVRDGRSFATRQVVAYQEGGAILNLIASFHVAEDGPDSPGVVAPSTPPPEGLERRDTELFLDHHLVVQASEPEPIGVAWMRVSEALADDPLMQACALAYLSDEDLLGVALLSHPLGGQWERLMAASLDHAVWFHRPARADEWLLFDQRGHGVANGRGMAMARVFDAGGLHVATVAQEGLGRALRDAP